jgi:hypothetical protein
MEPPKFITVFTRARHWTLLRKSPLILEAKDKLREIEQQGREVKFWWIPAHTGIEMSEIVDGAAKESVRQGKDSPRSIPTADLRAWWKVEMREDFRVWCIESGREKGENFYEQGTHPWFNSFKLRRRLIVSINRLRSGHTSLMPEKQPTIILAML